MRVGRGTEDEYIPIFTTPDASLPPDGRHDPPEIGDNTGFGIETSPDSGWNGIPRRGAGRTADIPELFEERPRARPWLVVATGLLSLVVGVLVGAGVGRGDGEARQGPGPHLYVDGVPEGFSRDAPGAVAAATSYVSLLGTPWLDDPGRYVSLYEAIAAPGARTALAESARRALEALETEKESIGVEAGDQLVLRSYPLATHVDSLTDVAATVRVWALTVLAVDGVLAPRSGWVVYTFSLLHADGTWRVSQLAAEPQGAGPDGGKPEEKALPEILTAFDPVGADSEAGQP